MKKILIRSGVSPFTPAPTEEIIEKNFIGGNSGNLIYQASIFNALTVENTVVVPDKYRINSDDAAYINENYSHYVIPLADAFRPDFVNHLKRYTKLIKKLKIPVIVIGVGLRAPFEPKLNEGFPFDPEVKAFVSAVLEKSSCIGVRGQITADYLTTLGFKEGKDHMVIGCPSMYTFGEDLEINVPKNITVDSKISINNSLLSPDHLIKFIHDSAEEFNEFYFVPQWKKELETLYALEHSIRKTESVFGYPTKATHNYYTEDKIRFFTDANAWINYFKDIDLSFGARLHGNITATIAGTPSILFPKDARMRELAVYHNLTHVMANEITDRTSIWELIDTVDFSAPEKVQKKNFKNFVSFLNKNKLPNIYAKNKAVKNPFENKDSHVKNFFYCSREEQASRIEFMNNLNNKKSKRNISNLKKDNKNLKKDNKHLTNTLNRKSIKATRNVADFISSIKK